MSFSPIEKKLPAKKMAPREPSVKKMATKKIEVSGVVQGVGFRPFLFVLAKKYNLAGQVSNTPDGVTVVVEGAAVDIQGFIADIYDKNPILACVTDVETTDIERCGFSSFKIIKSCAGTTQTALISPDVSVCSDCLDEMHDSSDRRYEYPFINCTNCGPRYTIIEEIPYDRPETSMKHFDLCEACQREYDDPLNRRFHAQPNACPDCGPGVFLVDNKGERIDAGSEGDKNSNNAINLAGQLLRPL
jgi:hydrogenase maturation protein HypF